MDCEIFDHDGTWLHQEKRQLPVIAFTTAGREIQGPNVVNKPRDNEC
jgi:hypothetical protein